MRLSAGFLKKNISLVIGAIMLLVIVFSGICAPWLTSYDPLKVNISEKLEPSSRLHYLGTDPWGRDILSRIMFGTRYSLTIGIVSITISLLFGLILGVIGGYYSESKIVNVIIWITDITMAFPMIILGAIVAMVFGPGVFNTIIALAVAFLPRFIRLARGMVLSVREETYITAAKSLGMSDFRLLTVHVIPNILSPIIVMAIIWVSVAISLEVALGFLGLGVPSPAPSWGAILQENIAFFQIEPLIVIWPCIAVAWTVQSLNLIGDRFRDILDPKMR